MVQKVNKPLKSCPIPQIPPVLRGRHMHAAIKNSVNVALLHSLRDEWFILLFPHVSYGPFSDANRWRQLVLAVNPLAHRIKGAVPPSCLQSFPELFDNTDLFLEHCVWRKNPWSHWCRLHKNCCGQVKKGEISVKSCTDLLFTYVIFINGLTHFLCILFKT